MPRTASRLDRWEAAVRHRHVPAPVTFLVFGELRLFEVLWQLVGRRYDIRPGEAGVGYAKGRLPVELAFGAAALIELVAVDLLVPWAERTRPHLVTEDGLVLRWGHLPIAKVPWSEIADVRVHQRYSADSERLTHDIPLQGTNLDIELREPLEARIPFKRGRSSYRGISLGVDDPEGAAALIRSRRMG